MTTSLPHEPIFERFECIEPPRHNKFYEIEEELTLFYPKALIRRWGRIGTRHPRVLRGVYETQEELIQVVRRVRQRRLSRGYRLVRCEGFE